MTERTEQSVANLGYHAHIYYDPQKTRAAAERVCAAVGAKFAVEIEEFRDEPRGPVVEQEKGCRRRGGERHSPAV